MVHVRGTAVVVVVVGGGSFEGVGRGEKRPSVDDTGMHETRNTVSEMHARPSSWVTSILTLTT